LFTSTHFEIKGQRLLALFNGVDLYWPDLGLRFLVVVFFLRSLFFHFNFYEFFAFVLAAGRAYGMGKYCLFTVGAAASLLFVQLMSLSGVA
jgi:hypothetical protein